jgi:hypothetical protein
MNTRQMLRCTAVAALSACAAIGARAIEATQWDPMTDATAMATASNDAMLTPLAWADDHREATQFRDGTARDSITARAAVRNELRQARSQGLMNDTGEGGATERVLAQREAFNVAEREQMLAQAAPAPEVEAVANDAIALLAAERFESDMRGTAWLETTPASVTVGLAPEVPAMPQREDSQPVAIADMRTAQPTLEPIAG